VNGNSKLNCNPAICLPYFVIGQFLLLTVSVNIRLVVKIVRCLVWQATYRLPKESKSIFGGMKETAKEKLWRDDLIKAL